MSRSLPPDIASPYVSWGRVLRPRQDVRRVAWLEEGFDWLRDAPGPVLGYGKGRSYGDSCLNDGGLLVDLTACDRLLGFDREAGVVRAEAGLTIAALLEVAVPAGFFVPVTPGTKHVTLGGAVANDVHGKNHHVAGTFGAHVTRLELQRSTGERLVCSPSENTELFRATIGGLGLTGIITWVELRLVRIESAYLDTETIRFGHLREFLELSKEADRRFEFTVAWVDCLATGRALGRGVFFGGNWAPADGRERDPLAPHRPPLVTVPLEAPRFAINPLVMRLFNEGYYAGHRVVAGSKRVHYEPFFYPLDKIGHWNRLYGSRGFYQYQFVIPDSDVATLERVFDLVARSGRGSFLAVLKRFGAKESPGLLSFPSPGVTLALDFANTGPEAAAFLAELDRFVAQSGGRAYPAKDAVMTRETFASYYPGRRAFEAVKDPKFSSSFWRRVT